MVEGFENLDNSEADNVEKRLNSIKKYKNKVYSANGDLTENLIKQLIGKTIELTI